MTGQQKIFQKKNIPRNFLIFCIVLIFSLGIAYAISFRIGDLTAEQSIRLIRAYGAPVAIPLIILEVVIAPIPGAIFPVVLGAVYGTFLGALYAWVGNVLGSIIAFLLAEKFGKKILKFFFPKIQFERFGEFIRGHQFFIWFMYALPVFPIDILSFTLGISTMKLSRFALIVSLAYIPHLILLTSLGQYFSDANPLQKFVVTLVIILITIVGFFIERHYKKSPLPK